MVSHLEQSILHSQNTQQHVKQHLVSLDGKCLSITDFHVICHHKITHDFLHSPQPKLADGYPNYTNCILTLIWSDGEPRTPPMMFTNDPKFRDSAVTTDIRKKLRSECVSVMKEYEVSPNQVIWMGGGFHYVPECTDPLKIYRAKVKVPDKFVIFSDKGNTFFQNKQPVIPLIFGARTATFPPAIHHYLSQTTTDTMELQKPNGAQKQRNRDGEKKILSDRACIFFLA